METARVGLAVGGEMQISHIPSERITSDLERFTDGIEDKQFVAKRLEAFL